jgi:hypothetical protein
MDTATRTFANRIALIVCLAPGGAGVRGPGPGLGGAPDGDQRSHGRRGSTYGSRHWRRSDVTARVNAQPTVRWTARSNIDGVSVVPRYFQGS